MRRPTLQTLNNHEPALRETESKPFLIPMQSSALSERASPRHRTSRKKAEGAGGRGGSTRAVAGANSGSTHHHHIGQSPTTPCVSTALQHEAPGAGLLGQLTHYTGTHARLGVCLCLLYVYGYISLAHALSCGQQANCLTTEAREHTSCCACVYIRSNCWRAGRRTSG